MVSTRLWDIWKRADTGPICPDREFVTKRFWPRVKEIVKERDIKYDPENLVPTDDTLLDDVFEAGIGLLVDVGFLCTDTERIIQFDRKEIMLALRDSLSVGKLGEGRDVVEYSHLALEDKRLPVIIGGPCGTPISEEIAVKLYESYAKEPLVKVIYMGAPVSIEGLTVKAGSPLELQAEISNIYWARTGTRKAGRPGMPIYGSSLPSLAVDMAVSKPELGYRSSDLRNVWSLPQMKVDYQSLTRAVHHAAYGYPTNSAGQTYIGGVSGGVETSMVTTVAECIATTILFQTLSNTAAVQTNRYEPYVAADIPSMWGWALATAAVNKNTHIVCNIGCYTFAGPCTEMCLYELAAVALVGGAIGAHPYGHAPNSGLIQDHCTPMESRFHGECAYAAAGMKRENANEMVKEIMSKYQPLIEARNFPYGKSFQECYDLNTLTPSKEYQEIYSKVQKDTENIGLHFKF